MNEVQKKVITYTNILYGSYVRLKELHFDTTNQAEHLLSDSSSSTILSYSDMIMENLLGMYDTRLGLDILVPTQCKSTNLKDVYTLVREESLSLKTKLNQPIFAGLNKILDDFVADLNKWIYLSKNK